MTLAQAVTAYITLKQSHGDALPHGNRLSESLL